MPPITNAIHARRRALAAQVAARAQAIRESDMPEAARLNVPVPDAVEQVPTVLETWAALIQRGGI
jgi:hypothetical protein